MRLDDHRLAPPDAADATPPDRHVLRFDRAMTDGTRRRVHSAALLSPSIGWSYLGCSPGGLQLLMTVAAGLSIRRRILTGHLA